MKKTLTIIALILAITVSLIAGTMSYYTITLDEVAGGSVVAKEFILLEDGQDTFEENVKIAPGEKLDWKFAIRNYDKDTVTGTDMKVDVLVEVAAAAGKDAIVPLTVVVGNDALELVKIKLDGNGEGKQILTYHTKADVKSLRKFTVSVRWPWESGAYDDIDYAGAGSNSSVKP